MSYRPSIPDAAVGFEIPTYQDLYDHAMDFLGQQPGVDAMTKRRVKRSIKQAINESGQAKSWRFFQRHFTFTSSAAISDTVTYTNSTRVLALDTESTPSWINDATLVITGGSYEGEYWVERVDDSGNIILRANANPDADLSAESAWLVRRRYPIPFDCFEVASVYDISRNVPLTKQSLRAENVIAESYRSEPSTPQNYTLVRGQSSMDQAIMISPADDQVSTYRVQYKAGFQDVRVLELFTSCSFTSGDRAATLSDAYDRSLVGCVVRVLDETGTGSEEADFPSGQVGGLYADNPWDYQRIITEHDLSTGIVLDHSISETLGNAYVTISSALDCMPPTMMNYLQALVCYHCSRNMRISSENPFTAEDVQRELNVACDRDDSGPHGSSDRPYGLRRQDYTEFSGAGNFP